MKKPVILLLIFFLHACAVFTVDESELQRGDPNGVTFTLSGRPSYDQVWDAAIKAMSNGMKIVESHKPSGTIKSRVGADYTGKVVALFISPTSANAPQYTIELVSKKPMGLGQPEQRNWEPSVIEDFKNALNTKEK